MAESLLQRCAVSHSDDNVLTMLSAFDLHHCILAAYDCDWQLQRCYEEAHQGDGQPTCTHAAQDYWTTPLCRQTQSGQPHQQSTNMYNTAYSKCLLYNCDRLVKQVVFAVIEVWNRREMKVVGTVLLIHWLLISDANAFVQDVDGCPAVSDGDY